MTPRSRSTLWRTQNFLRRSGLVDRLLDRSGIGPSDVVYDLGAGAGALTEGLAARCRRVVAVEADPRLCVHLRRRFADRPNVEVRCADVLDLPLPRRPYKVFASPPFDATAAIVSRLLGAPLPPVDAFLAVQREAAERFVGVPTETLYALLLKPWFAPSVEHRFRRADFDPAPGVDVVLLRLRKRGPPLVAAAEAQLYRDFVTACFTAWQPTLGDALARVVGPRLACATMRQAGVDPAPRPSATPFAAWLRLFAAFAALADGMARRAVAGAELGLRRQQARLRKRHRTAIAKRPPRPRAARAVRPGETSETRGPPAARRCHRAADGEVPGPGELVDQAREPDEPVAALLPEDLADVLGEGRGDGDLPVCHSLHVLLLVGGHAACRKRGAGRRGTGARPRAQADARLAPERRGRGLIRETI